MKKIIIAMFVPIIIVICVGVFGMTAGRFQTGKQYALIANTWNDFPKEKAYDVDAFPAQALQAYFVLKDKGYTDDRISLMVYHSNDSFVDVDGDGTNDLPRAIIDVENDLVTKESLAAELDNLARRVEKCDEVTIYLVGHGQQSNEGMSALSFENSDLITQDELVQWLRQVDCKQMIILLDFCSSGNFAKPLIEPGRLIVSTSERDRISWCYWNWSHCLNSTQREIFGNAGSSFFHPFWKKLREGATLQQAFEYGKEQCFGWGYIDPKSKDIVQTQNPQIYFRERNTFEDFVFFFPGGFSGLLIAATVILVVGLVLIAAVHRNSAHIALQLSIDPFSLSRPLDD